MLWAPLTSFFQGLICTWAHGIWDVVVCFGKGLWLKLWVKISPPPPQNLKYNLWANHAHTHSFRPVLVQQYAATRAVRHIWGGKKSKKRFGCPKFKKKIVVKHTTAWVNNLVIFFSSNISNIWEHREPGCNLDCSFYIWYIYIYQFSTV